MPRAVLSRYGFPTAATQTRRGLRGSTTIAAIAHVSRSPALRQCAPPSCVSHTPSPYETSLRRLGSPVPAQTVLESRGSTASAPIAPGALCGHTLCHVRPALVVFQTPQIGRASCRERV